MPKSPSFQDTEPTTIGQLLESEDKPRQDFDSISLSSSSPTLTHSTFHFNFDPDHTHPESDTELFHFFQDFGPQIRELQYTTDLIPLNFPKVLPHLGDIWKDHVSHLETLSLQIKWGCPAKLFEKESPTTVRLPSVKKLVLDMLVTEREAERAANFLQELLSSTPNLEEISIPGSKKFFDDYINVVLGRIILSLELPKLTTLNFCLALDPPQMLELANKQFPLKSLILDFAEVHHFSVPVSLI